LEDERGLEVQILKIKPYIGFAADIMQYLA